MNHGAIGHKRISRLALDRISAAKPDRIGLRPFFVLIFAALATVTATGAGLLWDASYVLFTILNSDSVFSNNHRFSNVLLQWPVVLASRVTDNINVISSVFAIPYISLPLISLLLSWLIVRKHAPNLFVWPVLGIGLSTLPGQMCFICDSIATVQYIWPILLAIAVGLSPANMVIILSVALFMFFLHPVSALMFAIAGTTLLLIALTRKEERTRAILLSVILFSFAGLRFWMSTAAATEYEESQMSLDVQIYYFREYVLWLPLWSLVAAWVGGFIILTAGFPSERSTNSFPNRLLLVLSLVAVMLSGLFLLILAGKPEHWKYELSFRGFGMISYLPFVGMLLVEVLRHRRFRYVTQSRSITPLRLFNIYAVGLVFFLVLTSQSLVFWQATNQLKMDLKSSSDACLELSKVESIHSTPLDHWSLPVYAMVIQGKTPETLLLNEKGCVEAAGTGPLDFVPWHQYQNAYWFNLQNVRSEVKVEDPCVFVMSEGWYQREQGSSGWWHWTSDYGAVRVFVLSEMKATIEGALGSVHSLDSVDILVNGEKQTTADVAAGNFLQFLPLTVDLKEGENIIEFVGHTAPMTVEGDPRPLAIAVSNLSIDTLDGRISCKQQN